MRRKIFAFAGFAALVLVLAGIFLLVSPSFAFEPGSRVEVGKSAEPGSQASDGSASSSGAVQSAKRLEELGMRFLGGTAQAADFRLQSLAGETVSSASMRGKIVFLNFWASWCPPCRAEMPAIENLYAKMKGKDFSVLALDIQENKGLVADFLKTNGYTFPVLLDSSGEVATNYGVRNIPTTFVLDKSGNILASTIGGAEWDSDLSIEIFTELARK